MKKNKFLLPGFLICFVLFIFFGGERLISCFTTPPLENISSGPGIRIYHSFENAGYREGAFAVCIPESYDGKAPFPLVVTSHGAGSSGLDEIKDWAPLAEKYNFIVVAPSYACATNKAVDNNHKREYIRIEKKMLSEIMRRVLAALNIDKRFIMHTGFSGGGTATWYVATSFPEYFTALCFRSANFYGRDFQPLKKPSVWKKRPVFIFWSKNDNRQLVSDGFLKGGEGPGALRFLKSLGAERLDYKIFPEGGHISRPEVAARWFAENVVGKQKKKSASEKDALEK